VALVLICLSVHTCGLSPQRSTRQYCKQALADWQRGRRGRRPVRRRLPSLLRPPLLVFSVPLRQRGPPGKAYSSTCLHPSITPPKRLLILRVERVGGALQSSKEIPERRVGGSVPRGVVCVFCRFSLGEEGWGRGGRMGWKRDALSYTHIYIERDIYIYM